MREPHLSIGGSYCPSFDEAGRAGGRCRRWKSQERCLSVFVSKGEVTKNRQRGPALLELASAVAERLQLRSGPRRNLTPAPGAGTLIGIARRMTGRRPSVPAFGVGEGSGRQNRGDASSLAVFVR